MANLKISQLTNGTPAQSGDLIPIDRSGSNFSLTASSIAALAPSAPVVSVFSRTGAIVATSGDYSVDQVTGAAPLASPTFTGSPAAPTPTTGDNSTLIATTAFVKAQSYLTALAWSAIGNAAADLTLANDGHKSTFNQTSAVAWTWANTTAATSSVAQSSPILTLGGTYWNGSASAADTWTIGSSLVAGTNGASILTIGHAGSSGLSYVSIPDLFVSDTTNGLVAASFCAATTYANATSSTPVCANASQLRLSLGSTTVLNFASSTNANTGSKDSGISRLGVASLAIGNGTNGSTSGNITATTHTVADFGSVPTSTSGGGTAGTVGQIVQHSGVLYFCSVTGAAGAATWNVISMTPSA